MRLLLNEMWDREIAVQLRRHGHDVIAATEAACAPRYRHIDDSIVFERAQEDGRAIVTDNIGDYEPLRLAGERGGQPHYGVVYALAPAFDRHQGGTIIGLMVRALDHFLRSLVPTHEPFNTAHWLQRAPN